MITEQDIKQATAYINGVDIYEVGALVQSFKVSGTAVSNKVYQGKDSTHFNALVSLRTMRTITLTLFYEGKSRRELSLKKAKLDNVISAGQIELYLPDGFYYDAYLTKMGTEEQLGVEGNKMIALCTYTLQGIRHDPLEVLDATSGVAFNCKSLIPLTDVRISVPANGATGNYVIASSAGGSVTINSVGAHDVLVIDGINKRVLQNGAPCSGNMSFITFPKLAPGENTITVYYGGVYRTKAITVEYYPTY